MMTEFLLGGRPRRATGMVLPFLKSACVPHDTAVPFSVQEEAWVERQQDLGACSVPGISCSDVVVVPRE